MTAANRDSAAVATAPAKSSTSDRELVATRVFDAPRELVFKLWTDPEHVAKWWGPRGFTITTASMDVRAGGVWRFRMHGPDGVDYPNRIKYTEVVEPERLAYEHGGDVDGEPVNFEVTATFEDVGGKTKLTLRSLFPSAEALAFVVEKHGAAEGMWQHVDRLVEVATEQAGTRTNALTVSLPSDREFRLTRTFDAPRALVWEAVTKPEHVARWWGPRNSTAALCEMDFRPGGAWRIVLRTPDGRESPFKGVYREIVAPERVVQTFIYDVEFIRDFESVETMTLTEHGGKTTIATTSLHPSQESRDGHLNSGMEGGAGQTFDRLAELLATMS
ncbi:MAG TPA: SRPBCC domain-containing protein [Isosphaeraceae bacterium]